MAGLGKDWNKVVDLVEVSGRLLPYVTLDPTYPTMQLLSDPAS